MAAGKGLRRRGGAPGSHGLAARAPRRPETVTDSASQTTSQPAPQSAPEVLWRGDPSAVLDNGAARMHRAWHVVAAAAEIGDAPVQVWLFGEPWVLARLRGASGRTELTAFRDVCPHRLAPLSVGQTFDGQLECAYHGWRFGGDGVCQAIPALTRGERISRRATLTPAAAITERYGLVWLAPSEPLAPVPEFPEWGEAGFTCSSAGVIRTRASAAQLVDNLLDSTHRPFIHHAPGAFGDDDGIVRSGWMVAATCHGPVTEDSGLTHLLTQCYAAYALYTRLTLPAHGATIARLFACQPEYDGSTRVFQLLARDDGGTGTAPGTTDADAADLARDLALLESFPHRYVHLEPQREAHVRADRLSLAWRSMIREMPT